MLLGANAMLSCVSEYLCSAEAVGAALGGADWAVRREARVHLPLIPLLRARTPLVERGGDQAVLIGPSAA